MKIREGVGNGGVGGTRGVQVGIVLSWDVVIDAVWRLQVQLYGGWQCAHKRFEGSIEGEIVSIPCTIPLRGQKCFSLRTHLFLQQLTGFLSSPVPSTSRTNLIPTHFLLFIYLHIHQFLASNQKKIHPAAKPSTIETRKHHPVPIHPTRWPFQTSVPDTVQCVVQPSKIHDHLVAKSTKAMGKATHRIVGTMGRGQSFVGRRKKFFNR